MTKTVHPVLKKTGAVLLTVLVLVLMAVPAFAVALPDAPTGYVYDGANVLSSSTESYIERTGSALAEACGAEDYYAEPGVGLTDVFTGGVLDAMLYDYLEDDFAAKEYDSGVKKVYARAVEILEDHYNVSYSTGTTNSRMRTPIIIMRIIIHPAEFYTDSSASSRGSGGSSLWFCSSF